MCSSDLTTSEIKVGEDGAITSTINPQTLAYNVKGDHKADDEHANCTKNGEEATNMLKNALNTQIGRASCRERV